LTARKAVSELAMLSLDGRVRRAADSLGFVLIPSDAELGLSGSSIMSTGKNRSLKIRVFLVNGAGSR
jgi:hypothetical protein